ncbi:RDD family protein [Streptomyces sp. NBC_00704]|uniref:RDD family protein n=1 Tax=Streptomyces sp. NBC_00704 TaxID=2975809 RepID=UPI002E37901D|nr:RDD family protein [Streptomyces sp. NBC_00704]
MDPLRGTRPEGALVEYVADVDAVAHVRGNPVLVLASHGRRIAARLVDTLLAFGVAYLVLVTLAGSVNDDGAILIIAPFSLVAGAVLYYLPLVHWWGTTVGKRVFGLRVVRLWSDGTLAPSWKDTFLREFDRAAFLSIPVLNLLVGAILLIQMAKDRGTYHQSKYDRAARTVVVRV